LASSCIAHGRRSDRVPAVVDYRHRRGAALSIAGGDLAGYSDEQPGAFLGSVEASCCRSTDHQSTTGSGCREQPFHHRISAAAFAQLLNDPIALRDRRSQVELRQVEIGVGS
jgi:hypothetical protein